MVTSTGSL